MRRRLAVGACLIALAACQKEPPATAGDVEAAAGLPLRRPGLWAQTLITDRLIQTLDLCVDDASDARTSVWGQRMTKTACSKNLVTRIPGGVRFESECDRGPDGHVVSTGTVIGDFAWSYVVKGSSVTTGAARDEANGTHEMTMKTAYAGPCPADMTGGDIRVDGKVINRDKMAATQK